MDAVFRGDAPGYAVNALSELVCLDGIYPGLLFYALSELVCMDAIFRGVVLVNILQILSKQLHKFLSVNHFCTEAFEVRRVNLAIY